jgi:hypothetical protein
MPSYLVQARSRRKTSTTSPHVHSSMYPLPSLRSSQAGRQACKKVSGDHYVSAGAAMVLTCVCGAWCLHGLSGQLLTGSSGCRQQQAARKTTQNHETSGAAQRHVGAALPYATMQP